jgi:hypothetical protein
MLMHVNDWAIPLADTLVVGTGVGVAEVRLAVGVALAFDGLALTEGVGSSLLPLAVGVAEHPARASKTVAEEASRIRFISQR